MRLTTSPAPTYLSTLAQRPVLFGSLLMIGASALFAVMAVAARQAAPEMSAPQLVVIRFAIMAVGTLLWRGPGAGAIRPKNWRLLGLRGILGGAAVLLYFVALARARDAGTAALLQYTSPLFTNLFGWWLLAERPSGKLAVGGLVAFAGVLLVLRTPSGLEVGVGELAAIASSVIAGFAVVTIRAARAYDNSATILFAFSVGGLLLALPFAIPSWQAAGPAVWGLALVVGVSSFFAQLMMTHAFGLVTAGQGAIYQLLTPIFTFGLGAALLGEAVTPAAATGALLAVGAIGWAALPKRPR
ncbi:DMT family transporter [Vulgatibacter sp.]|uniref:DMT family transporter n=1 Tax=Vulgatibacter sp. TaxID=1971226 RepID=UPI0035656E34